MSIFAPAPEPKSALGRHRILSPTADVRVSPLCLGAMNFGDAWKDFMGECNKETAFGMLDFFYEQGGNFIDTSNNYQNEESETWIGEWMAKRGVRDQFVIGTKFTTGFRAATDPKAMQSNYVGNGSKSLRHSVEASLKKLQTDYIDLLYIHWWDFSISIPELMQSLNHLVASGKVIYLGVSDTPAWIVVKANEYARHHGLRQFCVYQGQWSAANRDFERDIIPMVRAEGMSLSPWGALGGGNLKSEEQRKKDEGRKSWRGVSEREKAVSKVLEEMAKEKGTLITSLALAYVMHKEPYVFPIVGGRKVEHLKGNIEALSLELSDEDIAKIEGAFEFDLGFPMNFLGSGDPRKNFLLGATGHYDYVDDAKAIKPYKK